MDGRFDPTVPANFLTDTELGRKGVLRAIRCTRFQVSGSSSDSAKPVRNFLKIFSNYGRMQILRMLFQTLFEEEEVLRKVLFIAKNRMFIYCVWWL